MATRLNRKRNHDRRSNSQFRKLPGERSLRCEPLEDRRMLAVITVNTNTDIVDLSDNLTTLREAVFAANTVDGPDEIVFSLPGRGPHTIVLTEGQIDIRRDLTITGPGTDLLTIDVSGSDPTPDEDNHDGSRVFQLTSGRGRTTDVSISGVTLTGGDVSGEGGAIASFANLNLTDVNIIDNHSRFDGGGLVLGRTAELDNVVINVNRSDASGGGIHVSSGAAVTIRNSQLTGNNAGGGGGGLWGEHDTMTTIVDSSINENTAVGFGGGLGFITDTTTLEGVEISGNEALEGGGIYSSRGTLSIADSDITANRFDVAGGGLRLDESVTTITNSRINGNITGQDAGDGAGIAQTGGEVLLRDSMVIGNFGRAQRTRGGGIYIVDGVLDIENSQINQNRVFLEGGNLWASQSVVSITSSSLSGGQLADVGGSIWASDTDLMLIGSRLANNSATFSGGALHIAGGSTSIIDTELTNNAARDGVGGAIELVSFQNHSSLRIHRTVLLNNQASGQGGALNASVVNSIEISNSVFRDNRSLNSDGGAIYSNYADLLSITESAFRDNWSELSGGAIYAASAFEIEGSLFSNNRAGEHGGGIYHNGRRGRGTRSGTIDSTSFVENEAERRGGAIFANDFGSDFLVVNSTISRNRANDAGGGIYIAGAPRSLGRNNVIAHTTIFNNSDNRLSNAGGGGLFVERSELLLDHSIVFGNRSAGEEIDLGQSGTELIQVNYASIGVIQPGTALMATNLLLGVDPLIRSQFAGRELDVPGDRIFVTVFPPNSESPVVDAGDSALMAGINGTPEFDQRGAPFSRVASINGSTEGAIIDLGAVEVQNDRDGTFRGDFDGDQQVSGSDFLRWQRNYGMTVGAALTHGDATGDGDVDANDLSVWSATYPGNFHPRQLVAPATVSLVDNSLDLVARATRGEPTRSYRPTERASFVAAASAVDEALAIAPTHQALLLASAVYEHSTTEDERDEQSSEFDKAFARETDEAFDSWLDYGKR